MSGFYIGVDGKARKVKGGYIGVDGKARKIKKGYIGDENGVARLCWSGIDPVFANNSWEQIIAACQTRQVPDTWAIGDQKPMTINGVDYAIDIIGKDHDDYSDGSGKAPLTFQLHDLHNDSCQMNYDRTNEVGWIYSNMCTLYVAFIWQCMPTVIQNGIRLVSKRTSAGKQSSSIVTTADALFLLSEVEITGGTSYSFAGEGSQYAYYAAGGSKKKCYYNKGVTDADYWWTRSPHKDSTTNFVSIGRNGYASYSGADYSYGVSPAFCF